MNKALIFSVFILAMAGALFVGIASAAEPEDYGTATEGQDWWTGLLYGGLHAGYGFGKAENDLKDITGAENYEAGSFLLGGHVGFNFQTISPDVSLALGVEGDIDYSDIGQDTERCSTSYNCDMDIMAIVSIRGRAGIGFGKFQPFATAGIAASYVRRELEFVGEMSTIDDITLDNILGIDKDTNFNIGYVIGGGIEYRGVSFIPRVEVLYYKMNYLGPDIVDIDPLVFRVGVSFPIKYIQ